MAAPSGKQYGSGLRHVRVLALDANGYVGATNETVYEGYQAVGGKAFEYTIPDIRRIAHVGDDQLLAQTFLPRIEPSSGLIRLSRNDYEVYAVLTGTKVRTLGEAKSIAYGTSAQGSEPDVGIMMIQRSLDAVANVSKWRCYMLPSARGTMNPASLNENANEYVFNIVPAIGPRHLFGAPFTLADDGFITAEVTEYQTDNFPLVVGWKSAAGVTVEFNFHVDHPAVATAKIHAVTKNGVLQTLTTDYTVAVDGITFNVAPSTGDVIACFYETATV